MVEMHHFNANIPKKIFHTPAHGHLWPLVCPPPFILNPQNEIPGYYRLADIWPSSQLRKELHLVVMLQCSNSVCIVIHCLFYSRILCQFCLLLCTDHHARDITPHLLRRKSTASYHDCSSRAENEEKSASMKHMHGIAHVIAQYRLSHTHFIALRGRDPQAKGGDGSRPDWMPSPFSLPFLSLSPFYK